jgi:hypothetical protein
MGESNSTTSTSELTLDEAINAARDWQGSAELAIPAEIITGLVEGAIELRQALSDVRVLLLPDTTTDMRPSMKSITFAKQRIRAAFKTAGVEGVAPSPQVTEESK